MQEKKKFGSSFRSALAWNMLNIGVGQVLTLVIFLLLTTKLSPVVYGVFALALVFVEFFNMEGRFSIIDTLVQQQRLDRKSISTVYWLSTALYTAFAVLFMLAAPWVANLFESEELTDVLRALAVTIVFIPIMFGPTAVLNAQHDFRALALRVVIAKFFGGIVALVVAFGPHPEWALVAQRVVMTAAQALLLIVQTRIIPTFEFDREWAPQFVKEAGRIFMAQTCVMSLLRVLDVSIAAFFGAAAVGLWRIAERIMQAAFAAFANPLSTLWVILLSAKGTSDEDRQRIFLNLNQLGATVLVPIFVGIALISQDFIVLFVDEAFREVGPILALLTLFNSLAPFYFFRNAALIALKKTTSLVGLAVFDLVLLSVLSFALKGYGLIGVVFGLGIVYTVASVAFLPIVLKAVSVKLSDLLARVAPAYAGAALMGVSVLAVMPQFAALDTWVQMLLKIGIGAVVYTAYLFVFHRNWLKQAIGIILDREAEIKPA